MRRRISGYGSLLLAALGAPMALAPAHALDVSAFYDSCFIRSYDADHLAKHPGQRVAAMMAEIIEWEANPFVRITYALRGGRDYSVAGDCYDEIRGGFLCHLCIDESCDGGEQTFKVLLKGANAITIVNDTTGVTAKGKDDDIVDWLEPDSEHRAFALARTNYSACEN